MVPLLGGVLGSCPGVSAMVPTEVNACWSSPTQRSPGLRTCLQLWTWRWRLTASVTTLSETRSTKGALTSTTLSANWNVCLRSVDGLNLGWQPNGSQLTPKIEEYWWIGKGVELTDEMFRHAVVQVLEYAKTTNALFLKQPETWEDGERAVPQTSWGMRRWRMLCSLYSLRYLIHPDWMLSLTSLGWEVGCAVFHLCHLFAFQLVNYVTQFSLNPRYVRQSERDHLLRKLRGWLSSRNGAKRKPTQWIMEAESGGCNCCFF